MKQYDIFKYNAISNVNKKYQCKNVYDLNLSLIYCIPYRTPCFNNIL